MPAKRRPEIKADEIVNLEYFDKLRALLARLHDDGCARDKAGNRGLHYDEYCLLILLYLFNPIVTSLRSLQQVSELANVQKKLGCARASLGSLSDATTVFDPERLKPIIEERAAQVEPVARDARLSQVPGKLLAVDGTVIAALPKIMEASVRKQATGSGLVKWRLHTHFQVEHYGRLGLRSRPTAAVRTTNEPCLGGHSKRIAPMLWTAVTRSSRCSIRSSTPAAATFVGCVTIVPIRCWNSAP